MTVAPFLIPCLSELRDEFNRLNPTRDKGADGWIGDTAHQQETSDHNPDSKGRVLAIDIDSTGPWPDGTTLDTYVDFVLARCRSGAETRLEYIIRNRKIYERDNNWKARDYDGKDPHTNHGHFSARHDHTGQNDRSSWELENADMPTVEEIWNATVLVNGEEWKAGSALGYAARKGFETERDETATKAEVAALSDKLDTVISLLSAK